MPGTTTKPPPVTSASSLSRALTLLHLGGVTRRSELTSRLGLTRTATGTALRELEQLGLVVTRTGGQPGAGTGRPSHGIEIGPQAPMVVAIQVGVETLMAAEAELGAVLGPVTEVPLPDPATPEAVLGLVVDRVRIVLDRATRPCAGVGVALPTAVGADGSALAAHNLLWPSSVPARTVLTGLLASLGRGGCRWPSAMTPTWPRWGRPDTARAGARTTCCC